MKFSFKDGEEHFIPNTKSNFSMPGKAPKTPDSELTPAQVSDLCFNLQNAWSWKPYWA